MNPNTLKPSLGKKREFEKKVSTPSFTIEINRDFILTQSEIILTDIFLQISDLRKNNSQYDLVYNIEGITDEHNEYYRLSQLSSPTQKEIEKKLHLRGYLNRCFYLSNGTLYDYLNYSINTIIDLSFNKYNYILDFHELFISLTNCIQLFSNRNNWKNNTIKFDVFHDKVKWNFSIWISESELERLLLKFSVKDKYLLTAFAGLYTYDLSRSTYIEEVIPRKSYQFTIDYFQKRANDVLKDDCFKIVNWSIGLG